MPDERLEVQEAAPNQRQSSGPRRRRLRASASQTCRPVKLPCTRFAHHCLRPRTRQGWDLLHPSRGGTSGSTHRSCGREACRSSWQYLDTRTRRCRAKGRRPALVEWMCISGRRGATPPNGSDTPAHRRLVAKGGAASKMRSHTLTAHICTASMLRVSVAL
jgi:hypothetical protein